MLVQTNFLSTVDVLVQLITVIAVHLLALGALQHFIGIALKE